MIVFTNHTINVGVKSYEKQGGMYSSYLRIFTYIIEQDYVQIRDDVIKLLKNNECISLMQYVNL